MKPTQTLMDEHRVIERVLGALDRMAGLAEERVFNPDHARAFVSLLGDHIQKEDQCLFPMAEQALSPADVAELERRFNHVEHEELGRGVK
jgi:hemerythrin-like domain-containing protein